MRVPFSSRQTVIAARLVRLFHHNRSRKENVIFQVNVLVKISFKIRECLVQRLVADTGVVRNCITTTSFAHGTECVPNRIVFVFHHGHWVLYAAKRRW